MKNKWMMITVVLILVTALALTGCVTPSSSAEATATPEPVQTETEETAEQPETSDAPMYEAQIVTVTEATFDDDVRNSEGLLLVDFWAEWCGPCRIVAPVLEEVSAETGIPIMKVNVDENPGLANEFGINAIPAIYAFKDGEHVDTVLGAAPKEVFLEVINKHQ